MLFPDKSTATMLCFLTFGINLLPGKYLFPTSGRTRFYFLGNLNYYLIPDEYLFPLQRNFMLPLLGKLHVTCHQTIFELSYEESLLFHHKFTAPMTYILTFENNLQQVNTFPTSGKIVSTSRAISKLPYTR